MKESELVLQYIRQDTEVRDIMMQQQLKELGYYYISLK